MPTTMPKQDPSAIASSAEGIFVASTITRLQPDNSLPACVSVAEALPKDAQHTKAPSKAAFGNRTMRAISSNGDALWRQDFEL
jgi:hypothetical protein